MQGVCAKGCLQTFPPDNWKRSCGGGGNPIGRIAQYGRRNVTWRCAGGEERRGWGRI